LGFFFPSNKGFVCGIIALKSGFYRLETHLYHVLLPKNHHANRFIVPSRLSWNDHHASVVAAIIGANLSKYSLMAMFLGLAILKFGLYNACGL